MSIGREPIAASTEVTAVEALTPALEEEWEALARRVDAPPFLRPGYMRVRRAAFGEGRGAALVTARRGGELCGALPVVVSRAGLAPPSNHETPVEAILADDRAAMTEVARTLMAQPAAVVGFRFLLASGATRAAVDAAARDARRRSLSRVTIRVPVVHTAAGWDDYWASRSRNLRHNVERCTRRAREAGTLTFEMHDTFPDGALERLLREGFVVEASGWKGAQGTAILVRDETREYYTGLARWAATEGWLRLSFVRVDGDPIAFCLGIQAFGVHYALKVGYAEHTRRLSPGVLLFHSLIRRAFEDGLHTFDFAGHDQPYKSAWATGIDEYVGLSSFSRSPAGGAALAAARLRRRLAASPLRPALERVRTSLGGLRGGPPTPAIPVHGAVGAPSAAHTRATHEPGTPDPQGRTPVASGQTPPRVESTG